MYISKLKIKNFRAFSEEDDKEYEFELGSNITCIAGHNGIGKSTLLAMLGNCGELKPSTGKHLNGTSFRGEYSTIIKGDKDFDSPGEKCTITFADLPTFQNVDNPYIEELSFRATFQTAKKNITSYSLDSTTEQFNQEVNEKSYSRYRLIPMKTETRNTEKKIEWPSFYLGLSRLYPIGEADDIKSKDVDETLLTNLSRDHSMILSSPAEYDSASTVNISDTTKKKGFGVNTKNYSAIANSSGQDNVGQILLTIYSFEKLKQSMGESYTGGIFLIDEIDATLHPSAQNKLFDYLYKKSKELKLQIVFTTHSISLLQHILTTHRLKSQNTSISLLYLTNARGTIEKNHNPTYRFIQNDLLSTYSGVNKEIAIPIMTEDDAARWFLTNFFLLTPTPYKYRFISTSFGWEQITNLVSGDYDYYKNQITILDPDIKQAENKEKIKHSLRGTRFKFEEEASEYTTEILSLPGTEPIEKIIWDYLSNLEDNNKLFFDEEIEEAGITKRSLIENGPEVYPGNRGLPQIKKWFEDHEWLADVTIKYWFEDNIEAVNLFEASFNSEYNKIALRLGLKEVKLELLTLSLANN